MITYGSKIHYQDPDREALIKEAMEFCEAHEDASLSDDNINITVYQIPQSEILSRQLQEKRRFLEENDWQIAKVTEQLDALSKKHSITTEGKTADTLIAEVLDAEYPGLREKKQACRDRISEIEDILKTL